MNTELNKIAKQMVAPGKGILAADESLGTIEKRFTKINVPSTEENRRAYREMLFTTKGFGQYISGVILFDETIRQKATDGRTFVEVLNAESVLPGIKVDKGTDAMASSPDEKITKGLDGLPERLAEYVKLGAKFAKWRAVIAIGEGLPTKENIAQNARDLAKYAKMCQDAGLVPIVEPEVLMDGGHDIGRCAEVTMETLSAVFAALKDEGVELPGMILKPNMVIPGKESGKKASPQEVAEATLRTFQKVIPAEMPGIVFLSGGQSEAEATANLNEMNKMGKQPWELSFSYGRALQDSVIKAWAGKAENVHAAQAAFLNRAKLNGLARDGKYDVSAEN